MFAILMDALKHMDLDITRPYARVVGYPHPIYFEQDGKFYDNKGIEVRKETQEPLPPPKKKRGRPRKAR